MENPVALPADTFVLNPVNEDFIDGRRQTPATDMELLAVVCIMGALWAFGITPLALLSQPLSLHMLVIAVVSNSIMLVLIILFIRQRRFIRSGRLLRGEVTACRCDYDQGIHHIYLHYKFVSPETREEISSVDYNMRGVRWDRPLPEPGTPVMVLYQSDRRHRLL